MTKRHPVAQVANEHKNGTGEQTIVLSTGIKARLIPVPSMLIENVQAKIEDPKVPLQKVEGREQPVENPMDPDYIQTVKDTERQRAQAAIDAMVMFGVELVDGVPEDNGWLNKLEFLSRHGGLDLSEFDLSNELDREFLYKKLIAMSNADWIHLGRISGIRQEDLAAAEQSFPGNS